MTHYRLLDTGETIVFGDWFWETRERCWKLATDKTVGLRIETGDTPYRRVIPDAESVEPEQLLVIDPGEGYRLVADEEVVLPTDERKYKREQSWDKVYAGTHLRELIGHNTYTLSHLRSMSPCWKNVVFRRRNTKKIVLREYLERYGDTYRIEWRTVDESGFVQRNFIMPDEAIATGQEREIEIPA